jgi:tRNA-dihydrouridine synthase A
VKEAFPDLSLGINGGITSIEAALEHLTKVNEVMIGRAAIDDPYLLSAVDFQIYGDETHKEPISREEILEKMSSYLAQAEQQGINSKHITRHWLGLYRGQPGGRAFRAKLSQ